MMQQSTYFSFRQHSDWQLGSTFNLDIDKQGLRLKLEQRYKHSKRIQLHSSAEQFKWLDAYDSLEGWFWLNDQNQVYRFDKQLRHKELILKLELEEYEQAYRLAVFNEHIYVLTINSSLEAERTSLYCLYIGNGQLRWKTSSWKQTTFSGYALAVTSNEAIVIAAQLENQAEASFLQFDGLGYPKHEEAIQKLQLGPLVKESTKWNQLYRLTAVNDEVYLLDREQKSMIIYHTIKQTIRRLNTPPIMEQDVSFTVDAQGYYWFIQSNSERHITELSCYDEAGDLLHAGSLQIDSSSYITVLKSKITVFDMKQAVAYTIEPKQLPLYSEQLGGYRGWWISQPLDSKTLGTVWHRFVMTVQKQHDTTVNVKYFASDQKNVKPEQLDGLWLAQLEDPEDALFVHTVGRYLWICIELIGTDTDTPYIDSLEVHFPRQSYVSDLPVIYQRSDQGFLTHYLSIFQTMLKDTNLHIEGATRKLEPNQVSGQSLKWLVGWMGLDTDDYWSEEQLRVLLKEAPQLLRLRGTKYAIERLVEIYTERKPIILEYDDIKSLKENIELGEVIDKLYAADEHTFNVLVKADDVSSELKKITLQHILDRYKPVFTQCKLVILQPWVYMDLHSYLGMNTYLTAPQQLLLNGQMSMPHHTITLDVGQHNQLDKHTRIGLNSKLE